MEHGAWSLELSFQAASRSRHRWYGSSSQASLNPLFLCIGPLLAARHIILPRGELLASKQNSMLGAQEANEISGRVGGSCSSHSKQSRPILGKNRHSNSDHVCYAGKDHGT